MKIGYKLKYPIDEQALTRTINSFYSKKIKRPIVLIFNRRITTALAIHVVRNYKEYNRLPIKIENAEYLMKEADKFDGFFHAISFSDVIHEWDIDEFEEFGYSLDMFSDCFKAYMPELCKFFRILVHELEHASQTDHIITKDYKDEDFIIKTEKTNERYAGYMPEECFGDLIEYEAEMASINKAERMLKRYLKEISK